ncbi:MAG: type II methionyl aminopeptidase [Candidatus Hodarchaeales archaeon]
MAGSIAEELLGKILSRIKPSALILDICQFADDVTTEMGAFPAFPLNLSFNSVAAHDTAAPGDPREVPANCVVKADIGVHVDGWIADTAKTKALGRGKKAERLIKSAEKALNSAIEMIKPGVKVNEVSEAIGNTIAAAGFHPVKNLTGHTIEQYNLHAGISIPNHKQTSLRFSPKLREGMILAIEPFTTPGDGWVVHGSPPKPLIFSLRPSKAPKDRLKSIERRFGHMPFALRWLKPEGITLSFKELMEFGKQRIIHFYPPLKEQSVAIVAQAEHTVLVTSNGAEITTAS